MKHMRWVIHLKLLTESTTLYGNISIILQRRF